MTEKSIIGLSMNLLCFYRLIIINLSGIINKVLNENKTICGLEFPVCLPVLITSGKNWAEMKDV